MSSFAQPGLSPPPPPPTNTATASSSSGVKGGISGMLRKTGRKTRGALRGGGVRRRTKHRVSIISIEGEGTDSSESAIGLPMVMNHCPSGNGGSASARSPFLTPRAPGGNLAVEPAKSFYFSPLNSWQDQHVQQQTDRMEPNDYFGGNNITFPHQKYVHDNYYCMDTKITEGVEHSLRQVVICCVMFIAGSMMSDRAPVAYHILQLSMVAWGTSLFIIILEKRRIVRREEFNDNFSSAANYTNNKATEPSLGSHGKIEVLGQQQSPSLLNELREGYCFEDDESSSSRKKRSRIEIVEPSRDIQPTPPSSPTEVLHESAIENAETTGGSSNKQQNPHLENLYVMMVGKQERVVPNSNAYDIETELFSGKMLLMFRTPDVDEPTTTASSSSKSNDPVVNYFRGKQRRFEFQWQLRLKKLPQGDVFLGVEVDEPIHMGMFQRALANTALKFTKKMNEVGGTDSFILHNSQFFSIPISHAFIAHFTT